MVTQRPNAAAQTQLRRSVTFDATEIPVISTAGFRADSRKQVGDEFCRCAAFGVDAVGAPVFTGCERGISQEDGGSPPRPWPGGTPVYEVPWTTVEIVDVLPAAVAVDVGRQITSPGAAGVPSRTFVGEKLPDGTMYWKPQGGEDAPVSIAFQRTFSAPSGPAGIAISERFIWVADFTAGAINAFTRTGAVVATHGPSATIADNPYAMAYDAVNRRVGVCGTDGGAINGFQVWSDDFATRIFQVANFGSGDGQLSGSQDIAADAVGNWWLADSGNNRIQKFSAAGAYVSKFGAAGSGPGQFDDPRGLCIDEDGNVHVVDGNNFRVQKFSAAGAFLLAYGSQGDGLGQFLGPIDIVSNQSGLIFVADASMNVVSVFDTNGEFVTRFGLPSGLGSVGDTYAIGINGSLLGVVNGVSESVDLWRASSGDDAEIRTITQVIFLDQPITPVIWTNMPAAATVFNANSNYYRRLDLTDMHQIKLWVDNSVAGFAGSDVYLRYSTDFSTWIDIAGAEVAIDTATGHESAWADLPAEAKTNVYVQVWGKDGNAGADPAFKQITAQFR